MEDENGYEQSGRAIQEVTGEIQDTAGAMMGDSSAQIEGKARELSGKIQQIYADTATIIRDKTTDNPLGTVALVAVASFLLGKLWSSRASTR